MNSVEDVFGLFSVNEIDGNGDEGGAVFKALQVEVIVQVVFIGDGSDDTSGFDVVFVIDKDDDASGS